MLNRKVKMLLSLFLYFIPVYSGYYKFKKPTSAIEVRGTGVKFRSE